MSRRRQQLLTIKGFVLEQFASTSLLHKPTIPSPPPPPCCCCTASPTPVEVAAPLPLAVAVENRASGLCLLSCCFPCFRSMCTPALPNEKSGLRSMMVVVFMTNTQRECLDHTRALSACEMKLMLRPTVVDFASNMFFRSSSRRSQWIPRRGCLKFFPGRGRCDEIELTRCNGPTSSLSTSHATGYYIYPEIIFR